MQENEVISCILTVGVVLFVLVNYRAVARIPYSNLFLTALLFFQLSNIFTICEGIWEDLFSVYNALEHGSYAVSLILVAYWCGKIYHAGESDDV